LTYVKTSNDQVATADGLTYRSMPTGT